MDLLCFLSRGDQQPSFVREITVTPSKPCNIILTCPLYRLTRANLLDTVICIAPFTIGNVFFGNGSTVFTYTETKICLWLFMNIIEKTKGFNVTIVEYQYTHVLVLCL